MERTSKPEAKYAWEAKAVEGREGGSEAREFVSAYDVGLDEPADGEGSKIRNIVHGDRASRIHAHSGTGKTGKAIGSH